MQNLVLVKDGIVVHIFAVDDGISHAVLDPGKVARLYDLSNGSSFQDNPDKQDLIDLADVKRQVLSQLSTGLKEAADASAVAQVLTDVAADLEE